MKIQSTMGVLALGNQTRNPRDKACMRIGWAGNTRKSSIKVWWASQKIKSATKYHSTTQQLYITSQLRPIKDLESKAPFYIRRPIKISLAKWQKSWMISKAEKGDQFPGNPSHSNSKRDGCDEAGSTCWNELKWFLLLIFNKKIFKLIDFCLHKSFSYVLYGSSCMNESISTRFSPIVPSGLLRHNINISMFNFDIDRPVGILGRPWLPPEVPQSRLSA